jgi:hypothetical protein
MSLLLSTTQPYMHTRYQRARQMSLEGVEPSAMRTGNACSIQLSYKPIKLLPDAYSPINRHVDSFLTS